MAATLVGGRAGAGDQDDGGPAEARVFHGGLQEGRDFAVADGAHHVLRAHRDPAHALVGLAAIVLGGRGQLGQGVGTARDNRHHQGRGQGKGRHALGGLDGAQATGGADAHVNQSPARRELVGHQLGGGAQGGRACAHRLERESLLVDQEPDNLLGGQRVQHGRARVFLIDILGKLFRLT
jgi:hypothetical protein